MKKAFAFILTFFYYPIIFGQSVDCEKIVDSIGISYIKGESIAFTGHCVQYSAEGKLEYEGSYTNGLASGLHRWYYKSGKPREEITYVVKENVSIAEGVGKEWFENGKLKNVINYKNGLYDGEWLEYNKEGKIIKRGLYKDGKLIKGDRIKPRLV